MPQRLDFDSPEAQRFMYSPLRGSRHVNAISYDRKLEFWEKTIIGYLEVNKKVWFTIEELETEFADVDGMRPHCLRDVVGHMLRNGTLYPRSTLEPVGWMAWSADKLLISPVKWAYRAATGPVELDTKAVFVAKSLFDAYKSDIDERLPASGEATSLCKHLFTVREFTNTFLDAYQDTTTKQLLKAALIQTGRILFSLRNPDGLKVASAKVKTELSPIEENIIELKLTIDKVDEKVRSAEQSSSELNSQVRAKLQSGEKSAAKSLLRRKHRQDEQVNRLLTQTDNLHHILEQLEASHSDQQIFNVMRGAVSAMKSQNVPGRVEEAEALSDEWAELMDAQTEVTAALNITSTSAECETAELEEELAKLEAEMTSGGSPQLAPATKDDSLADIDRLLPDLNLASPPRKMADTPLSYQLSQDFTLQKN